MKLRQRIAVTVEKHEISISSSPAGCEQAYCKGCGREVPMLSIALAAALVGKPERLVYQGVEAGKLHFLEQPSGAILICLQSLGALQ